MSVENETTSEQIEGLLQQDLVGAGHQTFDFMVEEIRKRTRADESVIDPEFIDIKILSQDNMNYSLLLQKIGDIRYLNGCVLGNNENQTSSNTYVFIYSNKEGVDIYGNLRNSIDGHDWEFTLRQFANFLNRALNTLRSNNWKQFPDWLK